MPVLNLETKEEDCHILGVGRLKGVFSQTKMPTSGRETIKAEKRPQRVARDRARWNQIPHSTLRAGRFQVASRVGV